MSTTPTPIDANRGWRMWHESEIYTGPDGDGRQVPSVNDAVISYTEGIRKVLSVDEATFRSVLGPVLDIPFTGVGSGEELIGTGGGHVSESYRLKVDKSTVPPRASADGRLRAYGTNNESMTIFLGTDTSDSGRVISAYYNSSGHHVSDSIPLELVAFVPDPFTGEPMANKSIKSPVTGSLIYDVEDGELVTAVIYDNVSNAVCECRMIVNETTFVRKLNTPTSYISSIALSSNFVSQADPDTLLLPLNVPVADIELEALVNYSDSRQRKVTVDNQKVLVRGLESFTSTTAGETIPFTMTYYLDDNEDAIDARPGIKRHITKRLFARSVPVDGGYTVKLFVVPEWIDSNTGYKLRYYLYNLDGSRRTDVTDYVALAEQSPTFQPKGYGAEQRLIVTIELNDVSQEYGAYRHVSEFAITLLAPAYEEQTPWTISYIPGSSEYYGNNIFAALLVNGDGHSEVNIDNDASSQLLWLNKLHYDTKPLYGGVDIPAPRTPTHYEIIYDGVETRRPISEWQESTVITEGTPPAVGENILVRWVIETPTNDIYLGCNALVIRNAS